MTFRLWAPGILLTDFVMTGMDGLALALAAQSLHAAMRCVVVTGRPRLADAPPEVTWLAKPIDVDELIAALESPSHAPLIV